MAGGARAVRGSRRWMILNLGELAVRSMCSVQIQQDPLLIGYGKEDPTLQKEGVGRVAVFSKQCGEFQEFVRYPWGEMSCRKFDV